MHVAACFRFASPLDFQEQEEEQEEEHAKRVPDGHGRSFGSWPWQKLFDATCRGWVIWSNLGGTCIVCIIYRIQTPYTFPAPYNLHLVPLSCTVSG